jgi:hypothetical protein
MGNYNIQIYTSNKTPLFSIIGFYYYSKDFKYYTRPLHSEDAHSRNTQGSHSAYETPLASLQPCTSKKRTTGPRSRFNPVSLLSERLQSPPLRSHCPPLPGMCSRTSLPPVPGAVASPFPSKMETGEGTSQRFSG